MDVTTTPLADALVFTPTVHRDARGFFTRTFDTAVAAEHGLDPGSFVQDSQSRSAQGTVRGLHGRAGRGEAKLVRCARGAILDVLVDARPASATFGRTWSVLLDDVDHRHLYVPPGFLHGFQVLSPEADVCYRIDRPHDPAADLGVHPADPDLAVGWPLAMQGLSPRDAGAGSWAQLRATLD